MTRRLIWFTWTMMSATRKKPLNPLARHLIYRKLQSKYKTSRLRQCILKCRLSKNGILIRFWDVSPLHFNVTFFPIVLQVSVHAVVRIMKYGIINTPLIDIAVYIWSWQNSIHIYTTLCICLYYITLQCTMPEMIIQRCSINNDHIINIILADNLVL